MKPGMVLLQINEEWVVGEKEGKEEVGGKAGGREEEVQRKVGGTQVPCTLTIRDMDLWTRMKGWRPSSG